MTQAIPSHCVQSKPRANPYVGPRSFQPGEALFGRDVEIADLLDLWIARRIVLLYSPSGAGKSSLIQAGLLPRLENEGFYARPVLRVSFDAASLPELALLARLPGYNRYVFSVLYSLEAQVPEQERIPARELVGLSLREYLDGRRPLPAGVPESEALIFDQFEEILTLDPTEREEKQAFFKQLGEALEKRTRWALFAIREDYLAALDPYLLYVPTRFANTYRLDLLRIDAARQAMQQPARLQGVEFSAGAAEKLLEDLRKVQVTLPDGSTEMRPGLYVEPVQLQVVCYNLWEKLSPQDTDITAAEVDEIGSVDASLESYYAGKVRAIAGAVDGQADGAAERQERLVREWFERQLITPRGQRGRVLMEPGSSGGLDNALILKLLDTHLVRGEQRGGATWFELAHDRLVRPVRQNNAAWFEAHLALVQRQAAVWEKQGRPDDLLLRGEAWKEAEAWKAAHRSELLVVEQQFLKASRRLAEEEERRRREQEQRLLFERQRAEEQARNAARLRRFLAGITVLAAVALIAAVLAVAFYMNAESQKREAETQKATAVVAQHEAEKQELNAKAAQLEAEAQKAKAEENARVARNRELSALALSQLNTRQDLALLLGVEAWRSGDTYPARDAVLKTLQFSPRLDGFLLGQSEISSVAFSSDGQLLASGNLGGSIQLWDMSTRQPLGEPLKGHSQRVNTVAFSPDGKLLASGSWDYTIRLWDVATRQPFGEPLKGHTSSVENLAFSEDSSILASTSLDNTIRLWDVATHEQRSKFPDYPLNIDSAAFSLDGKLLAVGSSDGTIQLWDVPKREPLGGPPFQAHTGTVESLAFSQDGQLLASGSGDGEIKLWNVGNRQPIGEPLQAHTRSVVSMSFSQDNKILASVDWDKTILLWDVASQKQLDESLQGHTDTVWSIAFNPSPGGRLLASGSYDGTIRLWDMTSREPLQGHTDGVFHIAFHPNGKVLASAGLEGSIRLWDVVNRQPLGDPFQVQPASVTSFAFNPDGGLLASDAGADSIQLWDLTTKEKLGELKGYTGWVTNVVFNQKGKFLASGSSDGTIRLWDVASRQPIGEPLPGYAGTVGIEGTVIGMQNVALSPDGSHLAFAGENNTIQLWDIANQQPLGEPLKGHSRQVISVAFSPDGQILASGSWDSTIRLWDVANRQPLGEPLLGHNAEVTCVAFSLDGKLLASGGTDATVRLWDVASRQQLGEAFQGHTSMVTSVSFSPDGRLLASGGGGDARGGGDVSIRLWDVDPSSWVRRACAIVGRNFTQAEWAQYFPGEAYRKTCDQWP